VSENERPIGITGATGAIGGMVAASLAEAGYNQRLIVRSLDRAPELPNAIAFAASYDDHAALVTGLTGVDTVLMVSAAEAPRRVDSHFAFIDACVAAGVKHIVYTSFLGASATATFTLARDHYATEQHLVASGISHTILRDALYLDFMEMLVGDDGVIRGPAGDGRVAAVSRLDVARVAEAVLKSPADHVGATYDLTGPESLTMSEIAAIISTTRGRAVSFHNESLPEAYESRKRWGADAWQNDAWVSTYTAIAAGEMDVASDAVARITGTAPLSLAEVLAKAAPGA
jgi:uncharacterized protein YbjT (DUF2867 family)